MNQEKVIGKLENLISEASPFLLKIKNAQHSDNYDNLREGEYMAYRSSVLHFLRLILKSDSSYLYQYGKITGFHYDGVMNGVDILKRVLEDVKGGWLFDIRGIVSADIFSDFLDMAQHLLDENYKDPAAVIIGSVLEEHLRNLCAKNNIPITVTDSKGRIFTKKANLCNEDLAKKSIYNSLEQKTVTANLDLRNKAAHGKYKEYDINQVKNMLLSVRDFIVRNAL